MDFMNGLGPIKWIILGSIACIIGGSIASMCKNMFASKYNSNKKGVMLTKEQISALSMGAIISQYHNYSCNTLDTGLSRVEKKVVSGHLLYDYYKVSDKDSAIEMLEKLESEFHNRIYSAIKPVLIGKSSSFDLSSTTLLHHFGQEEIGIKTDEEVSILSGYVDNIKEAYTVLENKGFVRSFNDFDKINIIAWDMGRLVFVARLSYECEFITVEEAWSFIMKGYEKCKQEYMTWEDFSKGYIVGRAMWGGLSDDGLVPMIDVTKALLKDKDSPWVKNSFK